MNAPETVREANKQLNEIDMQTPVRGSNSNEYEIYTAFTDDNPVKTYDEWMAS